LNQYQYFQLNSTVSTGAQHGDFTMTESAAINTYLGDTFGDLVPKDGQLRGRRGKDVRCFRF
jgi:glutathione S-transferase